MVDTTPSEASLKQTKTMRYNSSLYPPDQLMRAEVLNRISEEGGSLAESEENYVTDSSFDATEEGINGDSPDRPSFTKPVESYEEREEEGGLFKRAATHAMS